ncbi:RHS repeat domain-containing protein [Sphingomonas morindae]|uniref:RHS repeat-associated core domain-containing protein n=1 Tax=Sphingomonas morindae TaxID=1541170 RepID=A0ABY4X7D6_9SPHN|nr:RHS repeat-associated core domain-containing protein [Sphingomonas morindae]USI72817.1 hypothetical protein LHA26_16345 [Sphingomonas morindae]
MLRRYVHGSDEDDPLVWYEGSGLGVRRFLHADHQGSIVAISTPAGALAINTYDEYGIPGLTSRGRFRHTGQAWIPELGLYHYKARAYSPTLGRFLQTDPIGIRISLIFMRMSQMIRSIRMIPRASRGNRSGMSLPERAKSLLALSAVL